MDAEGNKIILNIVSDALAVDSYAERLDKLKGYKNIYLYRQPLKKGYEFKIVKHPVIVAKSWDEWGSYFSDPSVDIVFYHAMGNKSYLGYKYIHDKAKLIWFPYGYDLYQANLYCSQLLKIDLYKSLTGRFLPCAVYRFLTKIVNALAVFRGDKDRQRWIARLDYCSTVLPVEYDLLKKQVPSFNAKPFLIRTMRGFSKSSLIIKEGAGNILLNHSGVYHDNHIDIIHELNKLSLGGRKIVMPINYGDKPLIDRLKKIRDIAGAEVVALDRIIPRDQYFGLVENCTHAIFGSLRQCAIGNIHRCLKKGIKVFLYKGGMPYQQFKQDGYVIYSIDDDLNQKELSVPLSAEDAEHNLRTFHKILAYTSEQEVRDGMQKQFDALFE